MNPITGNGGTAERKVNDPRLLLLHAESIAFLTIIHILVCNMAQHFPLCYHVTT